LKDFYKVHNFWKKFEFFLIFHLKFQN
jgi:hypothetical protein